ncbi:MAG: GTPase Era [Gammaproteobacteria bacterium]|nr:GTPase Era [Gammaproteobacteria bacterium]MCY4356507.1 GTPase Era [Gammaproteobacteria bacterium]
MGEQHVVTRCGYVAIVGRPNVGKSTLLNHLLRQKISITSRKPQTTRHRILGIVSTDCCQTLYVDTPGLHDGQQDKTLNRIMNETVLNTLHDVDAILFVVEGTRFLRGDERMLGHLAQLTIPVMLVINKVDLLAEKKLLLPHIEQLSGRYRFGEIVPVSALGGHNLETLEKLVQGCLPEGPFLFPVNQVTDRSSNFMASELIMEKVTRQLGDELPYEVTVSIESFQQLNQVLHIHSLVLVDKPGQKKILVGKSGKRLKSIGMAAREDMEKTFNSKVMLHLWVKVRSGWADDERALKSLGYME